MKPQILYEDNHIVVAVKPPNMPVQRDSSGDEDFLTILKQYIKEKYNKPGDVYLGLCHRLDRPVGGVMVFARTSKAASRLADQFKKGQVKKRYAAIVKGKPFPQGVLSNYILADENEIKARVLDSYTEGAKSAALKYRLLSTKDDTSLLNIDLITGRKHQIRAQLAYNNYPILFDQRYNPRPEKGNIALFAYALGLIHPTKKEELWFFSRPAGNAFLSFAPQIKALEGHRWFSCCYEDENILALIKNAGIETTSKDGGESSLQSRAEEIYGRVYPVHRLDANTPGIILFARNKKAQAALNIAINDENTYKIYNAISIGSFKQKEGLLKAWGEKDENISYMHVYDKPRNNAKELITKYKAIKENKGLTLLEIRLLTGRTHQIRAHLSHIGHPILGDDKYGDRKVNSALGLKHQALIAKSIRLNIPKEASFLYYLQGMEFNCPLPPPGYNDIFPNTAMEEGSTT